MASEPTKPRTRADRIMELIALPSDVGAAIFHSDQIVEGAYRFSDTIGTGLLQLVPGTAHNREAGAWIQRAVLDPVGGFFEAVNQEVSDPKYDTSDPANRAEAWRNIGLGIGAAIAGATGPVRDWLNEPIDEDESTAGVDSLSHAAARIAANQESFAMGDGGTLRYLRERKWRAGPSYTPIDIEAKSLEPATWDSARIQRQQTMLAQIGALTGDFAIGLWDDPSMQAYASVLNFANTAQITEGEALAEYATARDAAAAQGMPWPEFRGRPKRGTGERTYSTARRVERDPVRVAAEARAYITELLDGQEPSPEEMSLIAAELDRLYDVKQDRDIALEEYEGRANRTSAEMLLDRADSPADSFERLAAPDEFRSTATPDFEGEFDVKSRISAFLRDRYKPQVDLMKRQQEGEATQVGLQRAFGVIDSTLGGL